MIILYDIFVTNSGKMRSKHIATNIAIGLYASGSFYGGAKYVSDVKDQNTKLTASDIMQATMYGLLCGYGCTVVPVALPYFIYHDIRSLLPNNTVLQNNTEVPKIKDASFQPRRGISERLGDDD